MHVIGQLRSCDRECRDCFLYDWGFKGTGKAHFCDVLGAGMKGRGPYRVWGAGLGVATCALLFRESRKTIMDLSIQLGCQGNVCGSLPPAVY